ncbi:MAG: TlyA family RNA methyltransferase [Spirochaetota bacterium]|nr:TlyA family RNA methyltransferase [Spirochaetota bacterium]
MKYRLDKILIDRKLVLSREKAKANILAGNVLVDNLPITKVGFLVSENAEIRIKKEDKYVSRGGIKLESALENLSIKVDNLVVLDIGSSTGGFTDCLLQHGAKLVYSVDVGTNQIDYKLRINPQVIVLENLNAKMLSNKHFNHNINLAVIDVSFISLSKVLLPIVSILTDKIILALVKPQFEVGKDINNFKGVVRSSEHHLMALNDVNNYAKSLGLYAKSACFSPIKGPKGNIEFFILWTNEEIEQEINFKSIVEEAHSNLS